jgi:hypothetical protein
MHQERIRTQVGSTGFELIKARRIRRPDPSMPAEVRFGDELLYRVGRGTKIYRIERLTLFGRGNTWTYSLICFAEEVTYGKRRAAFDGIKDTFRVLDAPVADEPDEPDRR